MRRVYDASHSGQHVHVLLGKLLIEPTPFMAGFQIPSMRNRIPRNDMHLGSIRHLDRQHASGVAGNLQ